MNTMTISSPSNVSLSQRIVSKAQLALLVALLGFSGGYSSPSQAMLLNIPDLPLFVGVNTIPNVFIELDDSGSMDFEVLAGDHFLHCSYDNRFGACNGTRPDEPGSTNWVQPDNGENANENNRWVYFSAVDDSQFAGSDGGSCPKPTNPRDGSASNDRISVRRCFDGFSYDIYDQVDWRFGSSDFNLVFYNPQLIYSPWLGFSDANFNNVRSNPQPGTPGYNDLDNLAEDGGFSFFIWEDDKGYTGSNPISSAFSINLNNTPNAKVDLWDSYIRVNVTDSSVQCKRYSYSTPGDKSTLDRTESSVSAADCASATGGLSLAALKQNIANWYEFSRRRISVTKGSLVALLDAAPNFRYGTGFINRSISRIDVPASGTTDFTSHNQSITDTYLQQYRASGGTPLRRGLQDVGQYFRQTGANAPIEISCQKNFSLLFTDGFWNGPTPSGIGNVDGDSQSNTLADVARYYYETDLRPDLPPNVPVDSFDTNDDQHLVTYTIAFGLQGALVDTDDDGWPNPPLIESSNEWWNAGSTNNERRIDDLWHAAFNSKGNFISARRPEDLTQALQDVLVDIQQRTGTAASAATNGGSISTESRVYQAVFDSEDWSGRLFSFAVQNDGTLSPTPEWDAGALLTAQDQSYFSSSRKIYTSDLNSNSSFEFRWSQLTTDQQDLFDVDPVTNVVDGLGEQRVNMIRGVDVGDARIRTTDNKLGDLINSDPEFVAAPRFFFNFGGYQDFFNANKSRRPMVYVGSNDGMMHGFDAVSGDEIFSYLPAAVMPDLNRLTAPIYSHEFFVDGSPSYGDVQFGSEWKSVLASGLRSGGQGIFALDITNPDSFSAGNVLWEFTDADDADLGLTFGKPTIVKMNNDKWAVVIGNGYNNSAADDHVSTTGFASLFILFIEEGQGGFQSSDFVKITVPNSGTVAEPNGLGPVGVADIDGDSKADALYAGDLQGNLYKFDVSSSSPASWGLAFGSNTPLFTARTPANEEQPITSAPVAIAHPLGIGQGGLIMFGTGKFIEADDISVNQPQQTFYAVWDRSLSPVISPQDNTNDMARSALARIDLNESGGQRFFSPTSETVEWLDGTTPEDRGWYVDLPAQNERVVRPAISRNGVVFFVTLIPSDEPCVPGGTGFLMALDSATGGVPTPEQLGSPAVFDTNGDGVFDEFDNPGDEVVIGIEQSGIPALPAVIFDPRPLCEREPSNPQCDADGDGTPDVGLSGAFPPPLNDLRGCGSEGTRIYLYTTTSNGDISQATAGLSNISCGRQGWRQRR